MYIPERSLNPPEFPPPPLRCCLCGRRVQEALALYYGVICRECLIRCLCECPLDEAAALLCAPVLADTACDYDFEEEFDDDESQTHAGSLPAL